MEVIIGAICLILAFFLLVFIDYEITKLKLKNSYRKFIKGKNYLKKALRQYSNKSTSDE